MNLHVVHMLELYTVVARYTARIPRDLGIIGRMLVQAAYPARCEDDERRPDDGARAVFALDCHAGACAILLDQIDHTRMFANLDVGKLLDHREQSLRNLSTRRVRVIADAGARMAALTRVGQIAFRRTFEGDTQTNERIYNGAA